MTASLQVGVLIPDFGGYVYANHEPVSNTQESLVLRGWGLQARCQHVAEVRHSLFLARSLLAQATQTCRFDYWLHQEAAKCLRHQLRLTAALLSCCYTTCTARCVNHLTQHPTHWSRQAPGVLRAVVTIARAPCLKVARERPIHLDTKLCLQLPEWIEIDAATEGTTLYGGPPGPPTEALSTGGGAAFDRFATDTHFVLLTGWWQAHGKGCSCGCDSSTTSVRKHSQPGI